MAIKWLCTGKSEHDYQYKDAEGVIHNSSVVAIDFKAEIDTENASGVVNELFDTKPVLTEAGVTAIIGLQVYPQGFTVYADNRLSNMLATGVLDFGNNLTASARLIFATSVGGLLGSAGGGGTAGGGGGDKPLG